MNGFPLAIAGFLAFGACTTREASESRAPCVCASASPSSPKEGTSAIDFFQLIDARHSVRSFQDKDVSEELVRRIVAAANRAPSAGDLQAYEIIVVKSAEQRQKLSQAAHEQRSVAEAPLVLVFVANPARNAERYGRRGEQLYSLQDATIAASYAQLAAQALGLSSVWVGAFDDDAVLSAVGATRGIVASSLLAIGYPAEKPEATPRRSLDDLVHRGELRPGR